MPPPPPKVNEIFVIRGEPDDKAKKAKKAEVVVWVPETVNDKLDIQFKNGKSPFDVMGLTAPDKGDCIGAIVTGSPDDYFYTLTVTQLDGTRTNAEPEIIVDTGSGGPPQPKKKYRSKGKTANKKAGKTKGSKKKAAKRR